MKMHENYRLLRVWWLLLLCLAVFPACTGSQMPEQLIGKWESDHENYRECFMQIDTKRVMFGNKERKTEIGVIQEITLLKRDSERVVRIKYRDTNQTTLTLSLVYSINDKNSLWFENQPAVNWKRASLPGVRQ